jgi:hypothetical protein
MSRSTSLPPPCRSPSLEAVCSELLSCELLSFELCEPVDWLPLRLAVDEEGLAAPPLDDALLEDELDDELLEDWLDDELLDDVLLDEGLGGGLLEEGVGMLGGCGMVGLLELGHPLRTSM